MKKNILIVLLILSGFLSLNVQAQQLLTGGTPSASATYSSYVVSNAFDGDISNTGWMTNPIVSWLEYDLPKSEIVTNYSLICSSLFGSANTSYFPKSWNLQGYDGAKWVNIDTVTNYVVKYDEWANFNTNNTIAYQKYRLSFTAASGGSYIYISECRFFLSAIVNKGYSGNYTIGSTGKFKKIQEAVDSLSKYGVSGPVDLKIKTGFYAEQITIKDIVGSNSTNKITFTSETGNSADVTWYYTSNSNADNFVLNVLGASNLSFNKIGFRNASTSSYCNIVVLNGKTKNIAFNDNVFTGGTSTTITSASHIYSSGQLIDSLVVNNNYFITNASAMFLGGISSNRSSQIYFTNNKVTSTKAIEIDYADSTFVQNNTITNSSSDNVIYLYSVGSFFIEKNVIKTSNGVRLINVSNQVLTNGFKRLITNNIFESVAGYDNVYITTVDSVKFYNNTVLKNGSYPCLNIQNSKGVSVVNNFLQNLGGITLQSDNSSYKQLDYNNYFSVNPDIIKWNTIFYKTIDEFRLGASTFNQSSTQVNASLNSSSDDHFNIKWLDGTGIALPEIKTDINGNVRTSKPDIGAYEFTATTGNPLSGNLVVNSLKGPYKTLKAVFDSLMSCGINGNSTVILEDDAYEEQIFLKQIPGLNANNSLTIESAPKRKTKAAIAYTAVGTSDNYIMHVYGLDNITFKNLLLYTGSTNYSNGLILNGYCRKIVVDSCEFQSNTTSNNGNRIHLVDGGELVSDSIRVSNTLFNNNYQAIRFSSYSNNGQRYCNYLELLNNTMTNQFRAGDIEYCKKIKVYNNFITDFNYEGLYLSRISDDFEISKNIFNSSDVSGNLGLYLVNSGGVFGNNGLISNNIINVGTYNQALYLNNVINVDILSNTLKLLSPTYNYTDRVPLYIYGGSYVSVKNNILFAPSYNNVFNYTAPSGIVVSDYNAYYNLSTTFATWGTNSVANLSDLKTIQKSDLHSVFANPGFVSSNNLKPTSFLIDNAGVSDPLCVTDVVDSVRASKPDIGAYEFLSVGKPLHGTYYIQKDSGDFKSISAAATALNALGIDASVKFKIAGGTYYDSFTMLPIAGSSLTDTIVFEAATSDTVHLVSNETSQSFSSAYSGIRLNSASNITFRNLSFTVKHVNQTAVAVWLFGSSKNVHFTNCVFDLENSSDSYYTYAICASNTHPYYENISIQNNTFNNGVRPIYFDCNAGQGINFTITGNKFNNCRYDAIWLRKVNGIAISNNMFNDIKNTGIYLESCIKPISITKNRIVNSSNNDGGLYGINLNSCVGSFIGRIVIANNTISNKNGYINTSYSFNGINVTSCQFVDVLYNSVLINRQSSTGTLYALYATGGNNLRIRNNIFSNYHAIGYALYVSSGTIIEACDYNNLYTEGSSKFAYWAADYATLAALKLASIYNVTSISSATNFFSFSDLHTSSSAIIGKALPISSIDTDIDGDPRDISTPDIGADEIFCTKATLDLKIPKVCLGNALVFADSSKNVSVGTKYTWDFQNDGTNDLTSIYNTSSQTVEPIRYGFSSAGGTSYSMLSNPWGAFDGDSIQRGWSCNASNSPVWLQFKPMNSTVVNRYSIYCSSKQNDNYSSANYNPKSWILQASNDGTTWVNIDNQTNAVVQNDQLYQFSCSNTTSYLYYRIYVTAMQSSTSYLHITELSLYEATTVSSKVNFKYPTPGNYTLKLKATQLAGCIDSTTFPITVDGNVPVANAGVDEAICQGLSKTLSASGNGSYEWSTGETAKDIEVKPSTIGAVNYFLTVTATSGCTDIDTVKITVVAPFKYTRPVNDTICLGQSTTLKVSGAKTYVWNTGIDTANLVVSPSVTTKYKVNISDGNCVIPDSATVTVVSLKARIDSVKQISCYGLCEGYLKAGISDGFAPFTYAWSSNDKTNEIKNLCAGNYSVTVKDNTGCIDSIKTILATPDPITATFDIKPTQCKINDGSIVAAANGGNGGYTYLWKTDTTDTYSGLASGKYSVTIVDSKSCIGKFDVSVPKLADPQVQIQPKNVSCYNANDGSITVNVLSSNGTPSVQWNTSTNGLVISGLKLGSYSATITDTAGCSVIINQTITQPKQLSYSISEDTIICKNSSVVLFAAGGSQYKWSNNTISPQITVAPKTETYYKVTVSDGVCSVVDSIKVSINSMTVSISKSDASCFGRVDGSVSTTVVGGNAPYLFGWNIPTTDNNQTTISDLVPGTYTVTVTDSHNCSLQSTAQVNEPVAIDANLTIQNTSCDVANGFAKVLVNGGVKPYSYSWNTGSLIDSIGSLNAGIYSVDVQDKNGCNISKTVSVNTVNAPQVVIESLKMPSCYGFNDGQIIISGIDGTGSYRYNWSNGSTTQIITDITAGSYTVTISDSKSCKSIQTIVVNSPLPLTVVPVITNPGCSLSNGNVLLNSNGGTKPYATKWDNGSTNIYLQNLSSGVYRATVSDLNACSKTIQVNVNDINAPKVDILNVSNISCSGTGGAIYTSITGGTGNQTIQWSNGSGNKDLTGVTKGFYSILVTDENNCRGANGAEVNGSVPNASAGNDKKICAGDSVVLVATGGNSFVWNTGSHGNLIKVSPTIPTKYTVTVSNGTCSKPVDVWVYVSNVSAKVLGKNDATCYGLCNGSATISAISGIAPYNYQWSNGYTSTTGFASNLCAGTQTVNVTDAYSCKAQTTVTIGQPSEIKVAFDTTSADCKLSNGSIKAKVQGGTKPYEYYWPNSSRDTALTAISSGSYLLRIKDGNGCEASNLATINDKGSAALSFTKTEPSCYGIANGSINLAVSGGTSPYSLSWSNGSTASSISNLQVGPYDVAVVDAKGCKSYGISILTQPSELKLKAQVSPSTCNGSDGQATLVVTGGTSSYNYKWDDLSTSNTKTGLNAGIYQATVIDSKSCSTSLTFSVGEIGAPYVVIDSIKPEHCGLNDGSVSISAISAVGITSYKWSNGTQLSKLSNVASGFYSLIVSDVNNCKSFVAANVPISKPITPQICMVTVGSTGKNLVVWDRYSNNNIVSYNIYRESISKGVYQKIGNNVASLNSVFEDVNSYPLVRSYRYRIAALDQCANESELSLPHKTMHLTQNVGYGSNTLTVNLIWDEYQGINFGTTNISRGTHPDSLVLLESIPAGNFTYRDTPPAGHFYYQVAMQLPYVCDPQNLKSDSGPFSMSLSNMAESELTESIILDANSIAISPNPTKDIVNVSLNAGVRERYKLTLCDLNGRILYAEEGIVNPLQKSRIMIQTLAPNVYFLHVIVGNKIYNEKVIKE